jgi:hypothetical protein
MYYTTRRPRPARQPRADGYDDWWDTEGPSQITVHEPEDEPQPTGLLDIYGNEICRTKDRIPMGYRVR